MKIHSLRLLNIRCFDDTGSLNFSPGFNIFIGRNNSGKSTLLKAIFGLQINPFDAKDIRPGAPDALSYSELILTEIEPHRVLTINRNNNKNTQKLVFTYRGTYESPSDPEVIFLGAGNRAFPEARPNHSIVLFLAARKPQTFDQNGRKERTFSEDVSSNAQRRISGTLENLYSRIDLLANYGHGQHEVFREAVETILGLKITTQASEAGKKAGFYFDDEKFVTLDQMGDGVSEILALIVELCTEKGKIFILEEPEMNLHPSGLKSLLYLIRKAVKYNQFFISTHSNVVLRELGGSEETKIFQVFRNGKGGSIPSQVTEVEKTPRAHLDVLRDLGYEFLDYNLYEGWLFLEESSAETIINEILIPLFVPELRRLIRTYSAKGVTNVAPSLAEFQRLIVFIHLQPVYDGRLWVRVDGDEPGAEVVARLREKFPHYDADAFGTFSKRSFELYYPIRFDDYIKQILSIQNKQSRRERKEDLLKKVLQWTTENKSIAGAEWEASAEGPIKFLRQIATKLSTAEKRL